MIIRKVSTKDLQELSKLFDDYRIFYRQKSDIHQAKIFLQERIKNQESVIYVALSEENLITGFAQLFPLFSSTRMKRLWLLNDLYVKPECRGLGISKTLIDHAKKLVVETKACSLTLETEKSNLIGNKLYPRTDFILDEDHNYYYWNNK